MSTNAENKSDLVQQLEQMEVTLENNAKVIASYYRELLKQGISDDFAQKLVFDYHNALWSFLRRNQNPNA